MEQIGFPVGRPQTVAVDLTGRFLSASRECASSTSMRIYWDRILVDTSGRALAVRGEDAGRSAERAACRWRGSTPRQPTCGGAASPRRRRPTAASRTATTTRASPRCCPGSRCPAATRARVTSANFSPRETTGSSSRAPATRLRSRSTRRRCRRSVGPAPHRSCSTSTGTARRWTRDRPAPTARRRCRLQACRAIRIRHPSRIPTRPRTERISSSGRRAWSAGRSGRSSGTWSRRQASPAAAPQPAGGAPRVR